MAHEHSGSAAAEHRSRPAVVFAITLAAVVNAMLLFGVAGFVLVEAWRRLTDPPEVASGLMLAVAAAGLVASAVSMTEVRRHLVETPG